MDKNIHIQLNEINRLMNYDRSKTLLEQGSADIMVDRISMKKAGVDYEDYKKANELNIDELASMICGEKSMFAGGKVPVLDYPTEELACDIIATAVMTLGPWGAAAGLFIEFLHAKDLWNKGDKLGAIISMTIGLIPLIGDGTSILLRSILKKIGKKGLYRIVEFFVLLTKFLSGEIKATHIFKSITSLNSAEREMLYFVWTNMRVVLQKTDGVMSVLSEIASKWSDLPFIGETVSEGVEKIVLILNEKNLLYGLINFISQQGSIFSLIFGAELVNAIGGDPNNTTLEEFEKNIEAAKNFENIDSYLNYELEKLNQDNK